MRTILASLLVVGLLAPHPTPLAAQSGGVALGPSGDLPLTLHAQIRPRLEGRDPATPLGEARGFTSMRTRVGLGMGLGEGISAFVQIQDVRLWGEETSTLADFSADALDLHQAWVELAQPDGPLSARLGRQEVVYGGQRLVGAVDWTQQARAFDGVRARYGGERLVVDVFGFQLREEAAPTATQDASFVGGHATVAVSEGNDLDLYALWNRADGEETEQATLGFRYVGSEGPLDYRLEAAWQAGDRAGQDVSAWLVGARAGTQVGERGRVTLWYDHLSGDEPGDDQVGVFETLFATNHKFYGYADLFLNIPVDTDGRGLQDLAVKTSWDLIPGWTLDLAAHHFRVAESDGLESARLGEELDLTLRHVWSDRLTVSGGLSYVLEGDALAPVRGIDENLTFGYLMLDFGF